MPKRYLGYCLIVVLFFACSSDADDPETTARKWQELVDNNQFKAAKKISTKRAADMVDMIESIVFEDAEEEIVSETNYKFMKCEENGNRAVCKYAIIENEETVHDSFLLIKDGRRWLVDIPQQEELINTDEVEDLFKAYEKKLNQELK